MKATCLGLVVLFFFFPSTVIHTMESREEIINLIDRLVRYLNTESGTNCTAIFK